jgi:cytochrome P450
MASLVRPPGPKPRGIVGNLPLAAKDPLALFTEWAQLYGDIFHYRVFYRHVYFINHPNLIKDVLVTKAPSFIKGLAVRGNRRIFGNGLLASEGSEWLQNRRLIQPAFHHSHIESYANIMVRYTERMLANWQEAGNDGESRDIHHDMMHLTLEIVAMALFSVEIASEKDRVAVALDTLMELSMGARMIFPEVFRRLPTRNNRRYDAAVRELDNIVYTLIRERQANPNATSPHGFEDLLGTLLKARYEDGSPMPPQQIRDEVMTLLLAGHETTAVSLSWIWLLLSQHPEVEQKLWAELRTVLNGRSPTMHDLANLPYTERVVKEAMRIYPPVWATVREAAKDCEIGGYLIPAKSPVIMSQWVMHRDPRYYDRPTEFLPDRWLDERYKSAPRFSYFPFAGGPRICIGAAFAQTEAALVLATIAQQYQIRVDPNAVIEPTPSITLRPRHGIPATLTRRTDALLTTHH